MPRHKAPRLPVHDTEAPNIGNSTIVGIDPHITEPRSGSVTFFSTNNRSHTGSNQLVISYARIRKLRVVVPLKRWCSSRSFHWWRSSLQVSPSYLATQKAWPQPHIAPATNRNNSKNISTSHKVNLWVYPWNYPLVWQNRCWSPLPRTQVPVRS